MTGHVSPISVAAPGEYLAHGRRVEDLVDHAVAEGTRTVMAEERGRSGGGTGDAGEFSPPHPPAHFPPLSSRDTPTGTLVRTLRTPRPTREIRGVWRVSTASLPESPHPSSTTQSNDYCRSNAHERPRPRKPS